MCPTCRGELLVSVTLADGRACAERCRTCFGTNSPESYGARLRATLDRTERAELEEWLLVILEELYPTDYVPRPASVYRKLRRLCEYFGPDGLT